jgi:hypothetical protein
LLANSHRRKQPEHLPSGSNEAPGFEIKNDRLDRAQQKTPNPERERNMRNPIAMMIKAATVLGALAFAGSAQAAPEFKLRWGHYLPNSPFVQVEKDYAEAVKQRTNGRVEIEITFAGGLGKGGELMTLAGRGAIDMAAVVPGYYPDQLLFWKAYQIPFIFGSPRQAMEISAESYQKLPVFQEELDKFNVHFLFHQPLGSYFMTGPDGNCDNLAGLAGKKIRSLRQPRRTGWQEDPQLRCRHPEDVRGSGRGAGLGRLRRHLRGGAARDAGLFLHQSRQYQCDQGLRGRQV